MTTLEKEARVPGRIVISWTMSGGILFGMIGTLLTLTRQLPGFDFFITLSSTFVFGALAGMLHGIVLGLFSKPSGTSFRESLRQVGLGLLYSLLAVPVAFLVTLWIGFAVYYQLDPNVSRLLGAIIGGWIGLAILTWTSWETWKAVRIIVDAWPDFALVAGIVAIVFLVLVWFFEAFSPALFQQAFTLRQALFISGGIAVLIVGPLTTLGTVGLRRFLKLQRLIDRLEEAP